jgi:hypothetical protein
MSLQKVTSKKSEEKKTSILLASWKQPQKWAGSVSQWYGFTDPDPYQNVTDRETLLEDIATLTVAI